MEVEGSVIEEWPKIDWNAKVLFQKLPVQSPLFHIREMACHLYFEERSDHRSSKEYFELILKGNSAESPEFVSFHTKTFILDMSQNIRFEENNMVTRTGKSFEYCIWRVNKQRLLASRYEMVGDCEWLKIICFFGPSQENPTYKKMELELRKFYKKEATMEIMSSDYVKLFDSGLMKDVTIICRDENILAHKFLLCVRSKTFVEKFRIDDGVVDLSNMASSAFRPILGYIYSGKLPEITLANMYVIYVASHLFQLDALKMGCANFMISELTIRSSLRYLNYAHKCNDLTFKVALGAFIKFSKRFLTRDLWLRIHHQFRAVTSWNLEDENCTRFFPKITIE